MPKHRRTATFTTSRRSIRSKPLQMMLHRASHSLARQHVQQYPQLAIFAFDHIGLSINAWGRYENHSLIAAVDFLKFMNVPFSGVALDIGANIGNHAVFIGDLFKTVYAFEPNPRTFELLKFNSCGRSIRPFNFGLSDENIVAQFRQDTTNIGGSHVLPAGQSDNEGSLSVELRRLDDIDELKNVDISIIKVDVEGHEAKVLNGGLKLLQKNRPIILFEQTPKEIQHGTSETIDVLTELGYEFYVSRKNFELGRSVIGKSISFTLRYISGERTRFVKTNEFEESFYDMIIAFPTHKQS